MKTIVIIFMLLVSFAGMSGCRNISDPSAWSNKRVDDWFDAGEWLNGFTIRPDSSVNKRELASAWFKNKKRWNMAFEFLKSNNLASLENKRYDIDGDNLFATVSEYMTKNPDSANFEAHRKYIDIQYVINGQESIDITPLSNTGVVVTPYDESKDIEFMTAGDYSTKVATPDRFFVFFPDDAHKPGLRDNESSKVKKIVIKLRIE